MCVGLLCLHLYTKVFPTVFVDYVEHISATLLFYLHYLLRNWKDNKQNSIMDFKDAIKQISERIKTLKDNLLTEEATKNALIMPFINTLGYDVFNPLEVVPEMCCDIGTKKGEKIDYAILKDGEPVILIECKHWQQDLNLHDNQLLRYFNISKAKFGILTNGINYRFYTDLAEPNKMDEKPFLEVNLLDLKDIQIEELKKFHKSYFDVNTILNAAGELKYMNELRNAIREEFKEPSAEFVRYFGKKVYEGQFNAKVQDKFTVLVKKTISNYINELISERLQAAIKENEAPEEKPIQREVAATQEEEKPLVVTTEEEKESFYIVRSILHDAVPLERITYRDTQSYFSILIDDNNRKPVCRIALNSPTNKRLIFIDDNKKEIVYKISNIDEIYNHAQEVINAAKRWL